MRSKLKKPLTPLQQLKQKQLKKTKLVPLPTLVKKADAAFSRYVRLRDSEFKTGKWICECISCGRKMVTVDATGKWNPTVNAGHYIGRANRALRWDEANVNAQCARCNAWADKVWMIQNYRKHLVIKIGDDGVRDLEHATEMHKPSRQELEEIIRVSNDYVAFTLAHPEGVA